MRLSLPLRGSIRIDEGACMTPTGSDAAARGLIDRANAEPAEVMEQGRRLLGDLADADQRATVFRAMAIAARSVATLDESIEYARAAADAAEDVTVRLEALGTLAGSMASSGDAAGALAVLEDATAKASGLVAAQLEFQRGFVLTMTGEYGPALGAYEQAMPLFRLHRRLDFVAMALHNQGFIYTHTGRFAEAERVLLEARQLEESGGRLLEVAGTDHNLGLLASYRGDIPEALRRLTLSDEVYMRQSGDNVPRHVSRCEILLSVGLFGEAFDLAKRIATGAKSKGRAEDEADALLVAARAAYLAGETQQSISLAKVAAARFVRQSRAIWASQAQLVFVEASYEIDGASPGLRDLARRVATELESVGLVVAAARARILAGRIALGLGDKSAADDLSAITVSRAGPAELRLQKWQATAMLRMARGNLRGADAAARAGLDLLDEYQASLGASELRFGIERQGAELGSIGLGLAAESGSPRRLFRWMERTRARALRHPPVVPDDADPEQEVLSELRRVGAELRDPAKSDDSSLLRRKADLQEQLRRSSRVRRSNSRTDDRFTTDDLIDALGDSALVEFGSVDGRLLAVRARKGRFTMHEIGDVALVESELARLRFDLRRSARLKRDPAGVREAVERFDRMVLNGLDFDCRELVLVPSGPLMAAPWAVLPSLQGSTLQVAPSAEIWWRSHCRGSAGQGVVLAAGPDLVNAGSEIASLQLLYPEATVLQATDPVESFGSATRGAAIAHAACHATFEVDNPMFSSLRLGDGDFNVYDLERLHEPPELMVLSACDSGYTDTRAGDELTGLTSALLSMGSKSVVASVGLVPDSTATSDLMVRFHKGLRSGLSPSRALSTAQQDSLNTPDGYTAAASFLCIGG